MTERVGIKLDLDVDQSLRNQERMTKASERYGDSAARGLADIAGEAERARTAIDALARAEERLGAILRQVHGGGVGAAGVGAGVGGGIGFGGLFGAGAGSGGAAAPAGRAGGAGSMFGALIGGPGSLGWSRFLGPAARLLGPLGLAASGYQLISGSLTAGREADNLGLSQDAMWRSYGRARGDFSSFSRAMTTGGKGLQTSPSEFSRYAGSLIRETGSYGLSMEGPLAETKEGIGLALGLGVDREQGVSAVAGGMRWGRGKQAAGEFAAMLGKAIVDAGAQHQAGDVIPIFSSWQERTGMRGGAVNPEGWLDLFGKLGRSHDQSAVGAAGASMIEKLDASFTQAGTNPAAAALMYGALKRRGIDKNAYQLQEMFEGGLFQPLENGELPLSVLHKELMARDPGVDGWAAAQLQGLSGGSLTMRQSRRLLDAMGSQGMDNKAFSSFVEKHFGTENLKPDAYVELAELFSGRGQMSDEELQRKALEIGKRGRAPTNPMELAESEAAKETARIEDFGKKMHEVINALEQFKGLLYSLPKDIGDLRLKEGEKPYGSLHGTSIDADILKRQSVTDYLIATSLAGGDSSPMTRVSYALPQTAISGGGASPVGRGSRKVSLGDDGWQKHLRSIETKYELPFGLLSGIEHAETGAWSLNPEKREKIQGPDNGKGRGTAKGWFQILDGTWRRFGKGSVYDRYDASDAAGKYLAYIKDTVSAKGIDPTPEVLASGYHAGEGAVLKYAKYGGIPPYSDTRKYIPEVMSGVQAARERLDIAVTVTTDRGETLPHTETRAPSSVVTPQSRAKPVNPVPSGTKTPT